MEERVLKDAGLLAIALIASQGIAGLIAGGGVVFLVALALVMAGLLCVYVTAMYRVAGKTEPLLLFTMTIALPIVAQIVALTGFWRIA